VGGCDQSDSPARRRKKFDGSLLPRHVFRLAVPRSVAPGRHPNAVAHFVTDYAERMANTSNDYLGRAGRAGATHGRNIRELQKPIERAVILTDGDVLQLSALPSRAAVPQSPSPWRKRAGSHSERSAGEQLVVGDGRPAARSGRERHHCQQDAQALSRGPCYELSRVGREHISTRIRFMWIIKVALDRPYTFIVLALLILSSAR